MSCHLSCAGYRHEIAQIACVCPALGASVGEFCAYTLPKRAFDPMASQVTGLTKRHKKLYLNVSANFVKYISCISEYYRSFSIVK